MATHQFTPYLTSAQAVLAYAGTYTPDASLAGLSPADRELSIGLDLYAHIYRARCNEFHVAILGHHADLALQDAWQAEREDLVAGVMAELVPVAKMARAA